jgi:hypothetical protein
MLPADHLTLNRLMIRFYKDVASLLFEDELEEKNHMRGIV